MPTEEIINELCDYLDYRIQEGERTVSIDSDLLSELSARPRAAGQTPPIQTVPPRPSPPAAPETPQPPAPPTTTASTGAQANTLTTQQRVDAMNALAAEISACTRCRLHSTRSKTVPGQGCLDCHVMFVGEAPGHDEDASGVAFVGRAGQLLTKMIQAMGFTRDHVFIGNILKCRPPDNRTPIFNEMSACMPYLKQQIALVRPKVIVALGSTAAKALLQTDTGITHLRGKWGTFEGIPLMPTYHPAYLLRTPSAKADAWQDLKQVLAKIGRQPPQKK